MQGKVSEKEEYLLVAIRDGKQAKHWIDNVDIVLTSLAAYINLAFREYD